MLNAHGKNPVDYNRINSKLLPNIVHYAETHYNKVVFCDRTFSTYLVSRLGMSVTRSDSHSVGVSGPSPWDVICFLKGRTKSFPPDQKTSTDLHTYLDLSTFLREHP